MKVKGSFFGNLYGEVEQLTAKSGLEFIAFSLEAPPSGNEKYPTRLKCIRFPDKRVGAQEEFNMISGWGALFVQGDIQAKGYLSKRTGEPAAVLEMVVRDMDGIGREQTGEPDAPATRSKAVAAPAARPLPGKAKAGPSATEEVDDVPFRSIWPEAGLAFA